MSRLKTSRPKPTLCLLLTLPLAGCATSGGSDINRSLTGAAVGAAIGAAAGGASGMGALQGAGLGGVAGSAFGALVKGPIIRGRQYYRDTNGYCYFIDRQGRPVYDRSVNC